MQAILTSGRYIADGMLDISGGRLRLCVVRGSRLDYRALYLQRRASAMRHVTYFSSAISFVLLSSVAWGP